jgi:hypothetical protein
VTRPDATKIVAWLRAACVWHENVEARPAVEMSAQAITDRIRELAEMSSLCLELAEAGKRTVS